MLAVENTNGNSREESRKAILGVATVVPATPETLSWV